MGYGTGMPSSEVNGEAGNPSPLYRFTIGAFAQP
jgi:hypothetical protein